MSNINGHYQDKLSLILMSATIRQDRNSDKSNDMSERLNKVAKLYQFASIASQLLL